MKQTIMLFLLTSVIFGVLYGSLYGNMYRLNFSDGVNIGTLYGVISGFIFTSISILIQFIYIKRNDLHLNFFSVPTRCAIKLQIDGSKDDVFHLCIESVSTLQKPVVQERSDKLGYIECKTRMTWLSWGEVIRFYIQPIREDSCEVTIESSPQLVTTLIDYGKNINNVRKISAYIHSKVTYQFIHATKGIHFTKGS